MEFSSSVSTKVQQRRLVQLSEVPEKLSYDRAKLVYLLSIQEQLERPTDMIETLKALVQTVYDTPSTKSTMLTSDSIEFSKEVDSQNIVLTRDERNLLSIAYKNIVHPLRTVARNLVYNLSKEQMKYQQLKCSAIEGYLSKIRSELSSYCHDFLDTLLFLSKRYDFVKV